MFSKHRSTGLVLIVAMLLFGLGAPVATALEAASPIGYTVTFDATGIAIGSTYDLTIAGTTYSVTAVSGPDKTITGVSGAVTYSYAAFAYESSAKRIALSGNPSPSSPLNVTGNTDVSATYLGTDYLLTFDQIGLPVGTTYSLGWGPGGENNVVMTAGTPHTAWGRADTWPEITYYPGYNIPLGAYVFGSFNVSGSTYLNGSEYHITGPVNFIGTYISGNITGTVFYDYNGNGIQDPGEPGVPGATVELLGARQVDAAGELTALAAPGDVSSLLSTTSDSNGDYAFNNLPAGTFYVREQLPDGSWQESGAITLAANGGVMNSGQADFARQALLYTGK
jgi:hypothetical protein